jgi:uncharacterized protein (DUF4415 family)
MSPSKRKPVVSRTDWDRVRKQAEMARIPYAPGDGPYDPNDAAATEKTWDASNIYDAKGKVIRRGRGPQKSPTKQRISIRLSADVVRHFRSRGPGWQTQMDEVLQNWMKRHVRKSK